MKPFDKFIKRVLFAGAVAAMALTFSEAAHSAFRYNRIEEVPGLLFKNLVYAWDKLEVDVVNTDYSNRMFEGTMIFQDKRGRQLARASLLPKKIPARNFERYTAYFIEGSGEAASHASRVIWDFGAR